MNQSTTVSTAARSGNGFRARWNAVAGGLSRWVGHDVLALASRLSIGGIFFLSGRTKVDGFLTITDSTCELFRTEYKLPLIPLEPAKTQVAPVGAYW